MTQNARHVDWLLLVDRLRRTGMSIAEIRSYAVLVAQGRVRLAERRALLAAQRQRVLDTMADWQQALVLLDARFDFYGDWLAHGKRPAAMPEAQAAAPAGSPAGSPAKAPRKPPPATRRSTGEP